MKPTTLLPPLFAALLARSQSCPDYSLYSQQRHPPFSTGRYQLSSMRPSPACRTFNSSDVEDLLSRMSASVADPDLYRLFENSYPNTLDTAIRWRGAAADDPAEELTFVITGDIDAMWLRDSANQMQSYLPVLSRDNGSDSIAGLYRGVINLQARYLLTSPFCNSFQAPAESGIPPATNGAAAGDSVTPPYDPAAVFECKYELDSLAAFLEVSADYYEGTGDAGFFGRFKWLSAVRAVLDVAKSMRTTPTYGADGAVLESPYLFSRQTTRATETFANDGLGNPVANGTGLIRSGFRPSDDATVFQLFIPANMMFARYLEPTAEIVGKLGDKAPAGLAEEISALARELREAIETYGVVPLAPTPGGGGLGAAGETVYAYEVDGFGGAVIMDDANIPSLLAAPFFGYLNKSDATYQRTRKRILDADAVNGNPYFMRGPVINSVGGPHVGPGAAWPMASIVRILTSDDEAEISTALREIVSSTDGYGLIHESVNTFDAGRWTRQW